VKNQFPSLCFFKFTLYRYATVTLQVRADAVSGGKSKADIVAFLNSALSSSTLTATVAKAGVAVDAVVVVDPAAAATPPAVDSGFVSATAPAAAAADDDDDMDVGVIAGAVVGCVIAVAVAAAVFMYRRRDVHADGLPTTQNGGFINFGRK
jgi:hypothetical protein